MNIDYVLNKIYDFCQVRESTTTDGDFAFRTTREYSNRLSFIIGLLKELTGNDKILASWSFTNQTYVSEYSLTTGWDLPFKVAEEEHLYRNDAILLDSGFSFLIFSISMAIDFCINFF